MNRQKLITFKIDPNLDRMWKMIGLTQTEKMKEIQDIELNLYTAYQNCIAKTSERLEEMREELRTAQEEFRRVQKIYGDTTSTLQINSSTPLQIQIAETKESIKEIHSKYRPRYQELERLYNRLSELFNRLGISEDERDEFSEIGNTDITQERLNRFKQRIKTLDDLIEQRENLFASLENRISALNSELQENEETDIKEIFETESITDASLQRLQEEEARLEELKTRRQEESDELIKEIQHYYLIFAVDPSDQIETQNDLSEQTLNKLRDEVEFLRENRETRIPQVLKGLTREIHNICEQLKIPLRHRPKYQGKNVEEEILFLTNKLEELKKDQIYMQPIIEVISQIESYKDLLNKSSNINPRERGSSRRLLEEDKARRKAREELPRLEKKLLQYLVDFKEQHGYDFEFNGINYNRTYMNENSTQEENSVRFHRTRQDSTVPDIGKQLLMQKINESTQQINTKDQYKYNTKRGLTKRQQTLKNLQTRSPFS
ncbi:carboxypeptidase C prc1 [Tritrichomonas musculus]|uniref:Carboxypeptidase C prc1 n=1 Tax=Tritrichomonas musculus TaxID=1915356 RepID=A0ABR2GLQ6_9EUKA